MPKAHPLTKEMMVTAMEATKSNRAAARYLNVSYQHYRKYAKLYTDKETGKTFLEAHGNRAGKGIPKFLKNKGKKVDLMDVIEGRVPLDSFTPEKLKIRLFAEGYLKEECCLCGFKERRNVDYKIPLLLSFVDRNKKNYRLENLQVLCYNHYFIHYGDILSKGDMLQLVETRPISKTTEAMNFELDDYHLERLRELGLYDPSDNKDEASEYISRI